MRYWWITGVAGGAVLFGGLVYFQHFRSATPSPTRGSQAALAENGYVDPVTCAGCHPNIAKTYKLTGMGRSFYRPTRLNTLGESSKAATFYHKASDSYFAVLEHNGRFYQRRYQVGFDRRQTNVLEKEVDFVMGSGNHVRSYLYRTPRNTLVELPLAWYSENGGYWAMNPGYDRPDHQGFRREITYACMFCHNGIPEVPRGSDEPGAVPEFSGRLPEGIDCQRCHGPGRRHVEAARASGGKVDDISKAIVNPARLSADREMEVCMQCHLETTSLQLPNAIVRYGQGPFSYVPGEPLANFMLQFDQARGNDRFEIASSAYRLRRSKCFLKSEGSLRCTTCHNPHDIPRGQEAAQHYTQVCRQCHQPAIQRLVASGKHTQSADCLGCHMPKRRTEDVVHVVMTDHYIQRRKPAGDLLAPIPEHRETEANAYRGAVVPYYPSNLENTAEGELYLAMAQVSQKSNLKEGIPRLVAAIEKDHPERIEFYIQLADALAADSKLERAIPIYEDAVRREPRSFAALRKLATALRDSGQFARSAEVLKNALDVLPANAPAWHELGLSHLNQGLKTEAIAAFQKAIGLDPDAPEPYNSLGGVWLEARELSKAEPPFREAIRLQPDYAEARSNLGTVLAASDRLEDARYQFEEAIRLKPDYPAARFNYGIALARANRFAEAQGQIEALLKLDPGSAEAHDLLGNLMLANRNPAGALNHLREAVRLRPNFDRAHLDLGTALAESRNIAEALPHLRAASGSGDPAVRREAIQLIEQIEKSR